MGSLQCSSRPLAGFKGLTSHGEREKGRKEKGREEREMKG